MSQFSPSEGRLCAAKGQPWPPSDPSSSAFLLDDLGQVIYASVSSNVRGHDNTAYFIALP